MGELYAVKCWEVLKLLAGLLSLIQGSKTRMCFYLLLRMEIKAVISTLYIHRVTMMRLKAEDNS